MTWNPIAAMSTDGKLFTQQSSVRVEGVPEPGTLALAAAGAAALVAMRLRRKRV